MFTFFNSLIISTYNLVAVILLFLLSSVRLANASTSSTITIQRDEFSLVDSLIQRHSLDEAQQTLIDLLNKGKGAKEGVLIGKAYAGLGNILLMKGQLDSALKNYLQSLKYLAHKDHAIELAKVYANLGALYSKLKRFPLAETYLLKALTLDSLENNKLKYLTNLAGIYVERGKIKPALETFQKAISLAKSSKNRMIEAVLYTNLSNYFIQQKQWDRAIFNAQKSLQLRTFLKQAPSVITLNNLGYSLIQIGRHQEGVKYYEEALQTANLTEKKQLYYNLYQAYKLLGNSQKTWEYIEAYDKVKDSLTNLNYEQKVAELDATYQAANRQRRIEQLGHENNLQKRQLRQQTYLMLASALIILLILGIGYLKGKQFKIEEKLERSQLRRRFLLLQLNPHFIFNALQSVQHFIYQSDQDSSMEYLNSFSRLIRLILENSEKDIIPLNEEIEILDHYLRLQQLNSNPSFSYQIKVSEQVDIEDTLIPSMLLQPLLENAVIHGMGEQTDGKIELVFEGTNRSLHVVIKDNGKGIIPANNSNTLHKSMGMDILNKRITELNRIGTYKIKMEINTRYEECSGTCIHLSIAC